MLAQHSGRSLSIGFRYMLCLALLSALALVLLQWTRAYASALYVDGSLGSDSGNCQSSPCKTINYAITQAVSGDVINVSPGTFFEHLYFSKNLTISGAGPGATAIDQQPFPAFPGVVEVNAGSIVTITGVTIQNAAGGSALCGGGGVFNQGNLELNNVMVSGNAATNGAGICNYGNLRVMNSIVTGNYAPGDPIHTSCGGIYNNGNFILSNTQVISNQAGYVAGFATLEARRYLD